MFWNVYQYPVCMFVEAAMLTFIFKPITCFANIGNKPTRRLNSIFFPLSSSCIMECAVPGLKLWWIFSHVGTLLYQCFNGGLFPSRIQNGVSFLPVGVSPCRTTANEKAPFIPDAFPSPSCTHWSQRPLETRSNGLAERIKAKQKYALLMLYVYPSKPAVLQMDP